MILLFGNIVDAWVIKTEISEMKSSVGVVGVRLFVPLWINMSCYQKRVNQVGGHQRRSYLYARYARAYVKKSRVTK